MTSNLENLLDFAQETAIAAGKITLQYFRKSIAFEVKSDLTPVTEVDKKVEIFIRGRIQDTYPNQSILGEEFEEKETESRLKWIIDPIDGTLSFIRGIPQYTILLALTYDGEPQLGVIHNPATQETVAAAKDMGCTYNNKPCRVSETSKLSEAWIQVTDYADLWRRRPEFSKKLLSQAGFCRAWGDAYGYLLVATGRADVMIDPIMNVWDIAPLKPIITEAGGTFTDLDGNPNPLGNSSLASNSVLHNEIIKMVRE
jgi:histidinol phosphatase-like enzyme (inositol monophosphatase family)